MLGGGEMEIKNLITFMHVVELGSFTKAAEILGYSQPTISFQIKQLEEELDCLLFERINHTITLTERGHELLRYAHQIQSLTDEFMDTFQKEETHSLPIQVVVPDSLCTDMITMNYTLFRQKHPGISLKFTSADTAAMFEMLNRNEADIVITLDRHVYQKDYIIAKEEALPIHFVASSSNKFAKKKSLSIKDIINEPFILTEQGQGYRRVLDRELEKLSLEIRPALEIGRTDLIASVLSQSNMISFLPDFVTESKVKSGELCHLDICDINLDIRKQLIYHKNKWMSSSLKALIEFIKENEFKGDVLSS